MTHQTTKMLVEAGIVPKNAVQQLAHYRLVPEDYEQLHGTQPLDAGDKSQVETFVKGLGEAITKDMADLKETEFSPIGGYRRLELRFEDSSLNSYDDVLVDRMNRVIVPNKMPWKTLKAVRYPKDEAFRSVVKRELRYQGTEPRDLVIYAEATDEEGGDA